MITTSLFDLIDQTMLTITPKIRVFTTEFRISESGRPWSKNHHRASDMSASEGNRIFSLD